MTYSSEMEDYKSNQQQILKQEIPLKSGHIKVDVSTGHKQSHKLSE